MKATHSKLTAQQFWDLGDIGSCELIDGEVVKMSPAGGEHGFVANKIAFLLTQHVLVHRLGRVYAAETGFLLDENTQTVRAPDAAFIARDRVPRGHEAVGFLRVTPDLVVEVVSPNDRSSELQAKVSQWLAAGSREVWVADPQAQTITVHAAGGRSRRFDRASMFSGSVVLPGLRTEVRNFFEE